MSKGTSAVADDSTAYNIGGFTVNREIFDKIIGGKNNYDYRFSKNIGGVIFTERVACIEGKRIQEIKSEPVKIDGEIIKDMYYKIKPNGTYELFFWKNGKAVDVVYDNGHLTSLENYQKAKALADAEAKALADAEAKDHKLSLPDHEASLPPVGGSPLSKGITIAGASAIHEIGEELN